MRRKIIVPILLIIWGMGGLMSMFMSQMFYQMYEDGVFEQIAYHYSLNRTIALIVTLTCVVSVVITMIINKIVGSIEDALEEITKEVKDFKESTYKHKIRHYSVETINELAIAFDYMSERLYRNMRKLAYQKRKAETVLNQLEQGIVVMDEDGYSIQCNSLAKKFLGLKDFEKKYDIKNTIRHQAWEMMIEEAFHKRITAVCEIERAERILYMTLTPIAQEKGDGYILSIKDMTKTKKLEEQRYQFVSNVTHELKTPLTSIQGFVETLQSGALEKKEVAYKFLGIIAIETKRLSRLIEDILLLSEIEQTTKKQNETLDLEEVMEEIVLLLKEQAQKKGLKLTKSIQKGLVLEGVRRDHFKQAIINLVSNAIQYTEQGEVTICIDEDLDGKKCCITDTGIGIPQEEIPYIFQRFYRVDKSRSRQKGGTGLGLSIVKHIAKLYGWKLQVISEEQKGSTFKVYF